MATIRASMQPTTGSQMHQHHSRASPALPMRAREVASTSAPQWKQRTMPHTPVSLRTPTRAAARLSVRGVLASNRDVLAVSETDTSAPKGGPFAEEEAAPVGSPQGVPTGRVQTVRLKNRVAVLTGNEGLSTAPPSAASG
eukprot:4708209-Pyramimonas_sp.AAC.1